MAGTIISNLTVAITGAISDNWVVGPVTTLQAVEGSGNPGIVDFTTSETDISFGTMTAPGKCLIENTSATETLKLGPKSGGVMVLAMEIPPGEFNYINIGTGVTWRGRSAAGTVRARIRAAEK